MSNPFTLVTAQGTAAQSILTMLRDVRLIGSNKHTKLNEARSAILSVICKLYAELNRQEQVTRKNLINVHNVVTNMYGRASWAAHNDMMATLESALEAFITEATLEMIAAEELAAVLNREEAFAESEEPINTDWAGFERTYDSVEVRKWKSNTHKKIAMVMAYGGSTIKLARKYGWRRVNEVIKAIALNSQ